MTPHSFLIKLLVLCLLLLCSLLLITSSHFVLKALGVLLLGIMFAHCLELQHQCLHDQAFASKRLNRLVGFALGIPMLVSFCHYRARHLHHHAHLGRKTDSEFFEYDSKNDLRTTALLIDFFGLKRIVSCVLRMLAGWHLVKLNDEHLSPQTKAEYRVISMLLVALATVSASTETFAIFTLWILPLVLVAEPAHFLIELPEHFLCERNTLDVYQNTRSIKGSWFSKWLTNGNNFHVEHHRKPSLSFSQLENELATTPIERYGSYCQSYVEFYRLAFNSLFKPTRAQVWKEVS